MTVRPVIAEHRIIGTQHGTDTGGNGFLPDAKMHRAAHLLFGITAGKGLFHAPDAQHRAIKLCQFPGFRHGSYFQQGGDVFVQADRADRLTVTHDLPSSAAAALPTKARGGGEIQKIQ